MCQGGERQVRMAKYIVVAGGVISGTGKGIAAASIGLLLKLRGLNIDLVKFDPYLNINAGIIRPSDHGEVFVCDDGSEVDLDLGSYERLAGIEASAKNICTSGTLYKQLITEQESGKYLGATLQLVPHITDSIQERLLDLGKDKDVVIVEIGGTIGDNESFAFFEGIRQLKQKLKDDVVVVVVAPILWIQTIKEFKTKPLQNSVKELQKYGLQPDVIFCRTDRDVPSKILDKITMMTGVKKENLIEAVDVQSIYQVPIEFYNRQVDDLFVDLLRFKRSSCRIHKYKEMVEKYMNPDLKTIKIGIIGKYDNCDEAYVSLKESLVHAGIANEVKVDIQWIKSDLLEKTKEPKDLLCGLNGIIVPGGFDSRGVEGKIKAIKYCRENNIPFLGICLGLQTAVIEFARNVCGIKNANSVEFEKTPENPVVYFVEGQQDLKTKSANMRLGSYECELIKDSLAFNVYKSKTIHERHRHRFEINSAYLEKYKEHGLEVTGSNPETGLVEIMELKSHKFFIGVQFHPEYRSRLQAPAPLFIGLVSAALGS